MMEASKPTEGDDASSLHSSCSDLSFVITDFNDTRATSTSECKSQLPFSSVLTDSQYGKVIFHDVAERYPNNRDLLCLFTLNSAVDEVAGYDRIGLFRVPSFATHQYTAMKFVSSETAVDKKKKMFSVIFESNMLPKDEDFYQFQYLRNEEVFGASIPFQLRSGEELCTESVEEFEKVDRESEVAHRSLIDKIGCLTADNESLKSQIDELQAQYRELTSLHKQLQSESKAKNESFVVLDEQLKTIQDESSKAVEQLRTDFACALQDKLVLEERLHKGQKQIRELQTERDDLVGQVGQLERQQKLLKEEVVTLSARLEDERALFSAASKGKDLAVQEIKSFILKNDELQKRLDFLQRELDSSATQNETLHLVLEGLKAKNEDLECTSSKIEIEKDLIIKDLELKLEQVSSEKMSEISRLENELALKQKEFDVLSLELVNRSKNKFQQIDQLKKQLSETERSLNKCLTASTNLSLEASQIQSLTNFEMMEEGNSGESPLSKLESRIQALHEDFRKIEQTHAEEIKVIKEDLESFRSAAMANSFCSSVSSNDSRKMLDSQIINNKLLESQISKFEASSSCATFTSQISKTESATSTSTSSQTDTIELEPKKPELVSRGSSASPVAPPPLPPRPKARGFTSDVEQPSSGGDQKTRADEPVVSSLPDPLEPSRYDNQSGVTENVMDRDLTELVNWANGEEQKPHAPSAQILLTDDGRTLETPSDRISCPFCPRFYQADQVTRLQLHVESHMDCISTCPICEKTFQIKSGNSQEYQQHVHSHFPEDSSQPQEPRFWFLD